MCVGAYGCLTPVKNSGTVVSDGGEYERCIYSTHIAFPRPLLTTPPSIPAQPRATHMSSPQPFGFQLKRARERAGLSQCELATRIGVGQQFVSDLERGVEVASLPRVADLVAALTDHAAVDGAVRANRDELYIRLTASAVDARITRWQSHLATRAAALRDLAIAG